MTLQAELRVKVISDEGDGRRLVEGYLQHQAEQSTPLRILEAGCGRRWAMRMEGIDWELTGVDLDADALEARKTIVGDLDIGIVGDLRTVQLESAAYNVVYSWWVLEHIAGAAAVLERFVTWVKPGGILIVRVPDRDSVHGLMTRVTPFWFHVWFYRRVKGMRNAGKPGFGPYPTVYDEVISLRGMKLFAEQHGLFLREAIRIGDYRNQGKGLFGKVLPLFAKVVSALTFGQAHADAMDLLFVLERPN